MTVAAAVAKAGPYTGNDVTSSFAFAFKVFADTDIRVVETLIATAAESDLVLNTNYTVSRNVDQDTSPGGTITYKVGGVTTALPSTKKLTIVGDFDFEQPTDIPDGGPFAASAVERALDRVTMLVKQLKEIVGRAVTVDVSSTTDPADLIDQLTADAASAASSASAASASASAASASASAAAVSAASTNLPTSLVGKALNLLRVNVGETGYEHLTPAETRTALGLVVGTDVQAYDADIPTAAASQAEMVAGTEAALRSMSPLRVAQAISALAPAAPAAATQAEQEAASSTTVMVAPGRQQYHPSACKAWGRVTYSGGVPSLSGSYNGTSVSDDGTGLWTLTTVVPFSSTSYAYVLGDFFSGGGKNGNSLVTAQTVNGIQVQVRLDGLASDETTAFALFGDQ